MEGERYRIPDLSMETKTLRGLSKSYLLLSNLPFQEKVLEFVRKYASEEAYAAMTIVPGFLGMTANSSSSDSD